LVRELRLWLGEKAIQQGNRRIYPDQMEEGQRYQWGRDFRRQLATFKFWEETRVYELNSVLKKCFGSKIQSFLSRNASVSSSSYCFFLSLSWGIVFE
jgi:hypothetical protein